LMAPLVVDPEKFGRVDHAMLAVTEICLQDVSDPPFRLHFDFDARDSFKWASLTLPVRRVIQGDSHAENL
jgi:hypothetical protein